MLKNLENYEPITKIPYRHNLRNIHNTSNKHSTKTFSRSSHKSVDQRKRKWKSKLSSESYSNYRALNFKDNKATEQISDTGSINQEVAKDNENTKSMTYCFTYHHTYNLRKPHNHSTKYTTITKAIGYILRGIH